LAEICGDFTPKGAEKRQKLAKNRRKPAKTTKKQQKESILPKFLREIRRLREIPVYW